MSVTFGGAGPVSRSRVREMNLSNMNARAFLHFLLGFDPSDLFGELPIPDARRLVIRARATFADRALLFVRESRDSGGGANLARYIEQGIDLDYFAARLDQFESLLVALQKAGSTHVTWG
jgi:hypothetical protein